MTITQLTSKTEKSNHEDPLGETGVWVWQGRDFPFPPNFYRNRTSKTISSGLGLAVHEPLFQIWKASEVGSEKAICKREWSVLGVRNCPTPLGFLGREAEGEGRLNRPSEGGYSHMMSAKFCNWLDPLPLSLVTVTLRKTCFLEKSHPMWGRRMWKSLKNNVRRKKGGRGKSIRSRPFRFLPSLPQRIKVCATAKREMGLAGWLA